MKKKIAIFGGSMFQTIRIKNGEYLINNDSICHKFSSKDYIDNYSMNNINFSRVLKLLRGLDISLLYDICIFEIGEYKIEDPKLFECKLKEIIDLCNYNDIKVVLIGLPNYSFSDKETHKLQKIITNMISKENYIKSLNTGDRLLNLF